MKHTDLETQPEQLPWGRAELKRKHAEQMQSHQDRFGKLGELQTKNQKRSLRQALTRMGIKEFAS